MRLGEIEGHWGRLGGGGDIGGYISRTLPTYVTSNQSM